MCWSRRIRDKKIKIKGSEWWNREIRMLIERKSVSDREDGEKREIVQSE